MKLTFIGGGNMASAMIGGLLRGTAPPGAPELLVVERDASRRAILEHDFRVATQERIDARVAESDLIVLAVKPSDTQAVCTALPRAGQALILSIAAGIPSSAIARWCATECVVRAMPNTPALIGEGITGLFARAGVSPQQRASAEKVVLGMGDAVWLGHEDLLDAVTAISGSGPAYVFYFLEALQDAALRMGLDAQQARHFCIQTFVGAARLAAQSPETLAVLRERVTSKGGTTAAALAQMQASQVAAGIAAAAFAAQARSREIALAFAQEDRSA